MFSNIKHKRIWVLIMLAAFSLLVLIIPKNLSKVDKNNISIGYKIGLITDVHSFRVKKNNYDLNEDSRLPLAGFIAAMNEDFKPDFVVQNGDFIEGSFREGEKSIDDFLAADNYLSRINSPRYHVIGNHETKGFSREKWTELAKKEKTYYGLDHKGSRIIVLDGNEIEREDIKGNFYFFSENQLAWLGKTLEEAQNDGLKKIVFMHIPTIKYEKKRTKEIFPEQAQKVMELFSRFGVDAVFTGHAEMLDYRNVEGVSYFSFPGFFRSKENAVAWKDCYYEITVAENIEVKMHYKKEADKKYRILEIPSHEFDLIEK